MRFADTFKRYRWQAAAVISAAVAVIAVLVLLILLAPVQGGASEREVAIPEGVGARGVARILRENGLIRSSGAFTAYARIMGRAGRLQAGRYLLCACDSTPTIIDAIASGKVLSDDRIVTVPEGLNIWEIDALLAQGDIARPGKFTGLYLVNEGRYFPDTYRLGEDEGAVELADKMYATFTERASEYTDEQIIIASMLEKEAKSAEDMALVAGIMVKRLDLGMALQIDATVAYGWCLRRVGDTGSCDVTQAPIVTELNVDGPYNTYARTGLPAGPISNPGARALQAAANPKSSEYLFYLSTRDGSEIIFSKTAEEHLRNRREHLGF